MVVIFLDHTSCRQLELVSSLDGGWEKSLFGVMKHTKTPSGAKFLRSTILQVSQYKMQLTVACIV